MKIQVHYSDMGELIKKEKAEKVHYGSTGFYSQEEEMRTFAVRISTATAILLSALVAYLLFFHK